MILKSKTGKKNLGVKETVKIYVKDITENIMPFSKRLYRASIFTWPITKFLELVKIRSKIQAGNTTSARLQYITLKKQLWKLGIFYCEKMDRF